MGSSTESIQIEMSICKIALGEKQHLKQDRRKNCKKDPGQAQLIELSLSSPLAVQHRTYTTVLCQPSVSRVGLRELLTSQSSDYGVWNLLL